jgi:hypothetical protein
VGEHEEEDNELAEALAEAASADEDFWAEVLPELRGRAPGRARLCARFAPPDEHRADDAG